MSIQDQRKGVAPKVWGFDFSSLSHPLWWTALALLLINDNLLKGHGVVPSWLTGKLSDFAFLVVAPVLVTALLPLQLKGRRVVAFFMIASLFVAAEVSLAASDGIVGLAGRLGLRWRLWPDLTDLLALLVLPASWWVAGTRGCRRTYPAKSLLHAAGMCVGVFACLATGSIASEPDQYPFVINRTTNPRTVSLTWLLRKTPCSVHAQELAASLASNDLDSTYTVRLESGQVAALDAPPATEVVAGLCQTLKSISSSGRNCMAAVVTVEDGPSVLVSSTRYDRADGAEKDSIGDLVSCGDDSASKIPACAPTLPIDKDPGRFALSVIETGGQLTVEVGRELTMAPIDLAEVATRTSAFDCRVLRGQMQTMLADSTSCSTDADCQVVALDLAIPAAGICNVYVNRSLSFEALAQQRDLWRENCSLDDRQHCPTGGAKPPACVEGRCVEVCAGTAVPACSPSCPFSASPAGKHCSASVEGSCLATDGQLCSCTGPNTTYACKPRPDIPGCPILCASTLPATLPINVVRPAVDAATIDATIDAVNGARGDAFDGKPGGD